MNLTLCKLIIRISFLRKQYYIATEIQSPIIKFFSCQNHVCVHKYTQALSGLWIVYDLPSLPRRRYSSVGFYRWSQRLMDQEKNFHKNNWVARLFQETQCLIIEFPSWKMSLSLNSLLQSSSEGCVFLIYSPHLCLTAELDHCVLSLSLSFFVCLSVYLKFMLFRPPETKSWQVEFSNIYRSQILS